MSAVRLLAKVLRANGHSVREHGSWLALDHGLTLQPRIADVSKIESSTRWRTSTTIEAQQVGLFPSGVFEFQHSNAADVVVGLRSGFEQFARFDLPVLRAAGARQSTDCSFIDFKERYQTTTLANARRVVLGPVSWTVKDSAAAQNEEHPFCPCCFFTHSHEAMLEKLNARGLFAVRLFASRHPGQEVEADCRVNGLDWPAGKQALIAYAKTWPDRGFEMRRQYIVIQDLP